MTGVHWEFNLISSLLIQTPTLTISEGMKLPLELGRWDGILPATIHSQKKALDFACLFECWRSGLTLLASPGKLLHSKVAILLPDIPKVYDKKMVT